MSLDQDLHRDDCTPPAPPAPDIELPAPQLAYGRRRHGHGPHGQLRHVSPVQRPPDDLQPLPAQFPDQVLGADGSEMKFGQPRQPAAALNRYAEGVYDLLVSDIRPWIGEE
jgi:hypothetical protein